MRIANFSRSQRTPIVQGILCIVSVIAVMQLWLFTTTMEAYLGGDESFVLPAALASMICLGLNLGLFHYLRALDR